MQEIVIHRINIENIDYSISNNSYNIFSVVFFKAIYNVLNPEHL